jgi:hypothetical protein
MVATRVFVRSLVGINFSQWLLRNLLIAKACATSKFALPLNSASFITLASVDQSNGPRWPTPTRTAIGASTAIFAHRLIRIARPLYAHSELGLELEATAYAFDATTIDLCLSLFPWAKFRKHKGAIKLHTPLLEIHSAIPVFIAITAGDVHEVNLLDELIPEPGSFIVMDRGFIDFQRLYRLHTALAFFVIRSKSNLTFRRRYSHPHHRATGVRSDQTIVLTGPLTSQLYQIALRRVHYYSAETDQRLVLLTNNFSIPALTVAALYRYRWQIELFFKWIKQHLRIKNSIKNFFGTSDNSVKTQIWIAISVYVMVRCAVSILILKLKFN